MTHEWCDQESAQIAEAKHGTDQLLAALINHHDFSIRPPAGWRKRLRPSDPPFVIPPPRKKEVKFWFEVVDEEIAHTPRVADIKQAACEYFGITRAEIDSDRRTVKIVYPRQVAVYLSRLLTTKSYPELGRRFGGRDHTTILHAVHKLERESRQDWRVAYDVAMVEARL